MGMKVSKTKELSLTMLINQKSEMLITFIYSEVTQSCLPKLLFL